MAEPLSSETLAYLERQEKSLDELIQSIRETPRESRGDLQEIARNIAQLKEEIKVGKEDDLPGLFYQLNIQHTLAKRFSEAVAFPDCDSPYFGHMRLLENGKTRDIFLGHVSFIPKSKDVRIVDWKSAPISRIFYQYSEGEDYELELPGKDIEGKVLELSILTIHNARLTRVDKGGQSYINGENGWEILEEDDLKLEGGEGSAVRELSLGTGRTNYRGPEVIGLLDQEQFALLNRSATEPLLIIGGAGSGKTTVALHRIASLCGKRKIYPNQALVIVPHKGLIRLSRQLLSQIGLHKVKIRTGQDWVQDQARRLIDDIPKRISHTTPLGVTILKRHLSLDSVFDRYLEDREKELIEKLHKISEKEDLGRLFVKYCHLCLMERLDKIESEVDLTSLQKLSFKDEKEKLGNVLGDLHNIFSSKKYLSLLPELSGGHITQNMIEATLMHTAHQLRVADDNTAANTTLDGRDADEGTPFEARGTIDEEDFPLLLYLLKRKCGAIETRKGGLKQYHHIVLDEAQELAPFELKVFAAAIHQKGSVTVAGDSAQQVDASISFEGWSNVLKHLNVEEVDANELTISYRSPGKIIDFSHHVLGDLAGKKPVAKRIGAPVKISTIQHRAHGSMLLYDALKDLSLREPSASTAIICSDMDTAKQFYSELNELDRVRLIEDSEFSFKPGIDITHVEQIRGLEFDYVILPDCDRHHYPDLPRMRRRLHLAATRAIHQLWVLYAGEKSPLIP